MLRPPAVLLLVLGLAACGFEPGDHGAGIGGSSDASASGETDGASAEGLDAPGGGGALDAGQVSTPDALVSAPDAAVAPTYDARPPRADGSRDYSCREDEDCPRDFRCKNDRCEWNGGGGHGGHGGGD